MVMEPLYIFKSDMKQELLYGSETSRTKAVVNKIH